MTNPGENWMFIGLASQRRERGGVLGKDNDVLSCSIITFSFSFFCGLLYHFTLSAFCHSGWEATVEFGAIVLSVWARTINIRATASTYYQSEATTVMIIAVMLTTKAGYQNVWMYKLISRAGSILKELESAPKYLIEIKILLF